MSCKYKSANLIYYRSRNYVIADYSELNNLKAYFTPSESEDFL